jgi:hypothetical protein
MLLAAATTEVAWVVIELGAAVLGLAILARLASRQGVSPIPLYLLGGLAFGNGGLLAVVGPVLAQVAAVRFPPPRPADGDSVPAGSS